MKLVNKSIYASILMLFISTPAVYANSENTYHKNNNNNFIELIYKDVCINNIFNIVKKNINEDSEYFKSEIKYPYLEIKSNYINKGKMNIKIINNINDVISKIAINFNNEIKKESIKYKEYHEKELYKNQDIKYQYQAYIDYKVTYNKNNLLSIPLTIYEFTGGAHGLTNIKTLSYDLATGKELQLHNLFKKDSNYEEVINKFIANEISKEPSIYFSKEDGFKGIRENQSFYISDEGIVVYFSLYEIAPYSTGIPMFTLTWDKLSNILVDSQLDK